MHRNGTTVHILVWRTLYCENVKSLRRNAKYKGDSTLINTTQQC